MTVKVPGFNEEPQPKVGEHWFQKLNSAWYFLRVDEVSASGTITSRSWGCRSTLAPHTASPPTTKHAAWEWMEGTETTAGGFRTHEGEWTKVKDLLCAECNAGIDGTDYLCPDCRAK